CKLSCPACGFREDYVAFGLAAGCMSTIALAQDERTGSLRAIEVYLHEILEQNGGPMASYQEIGYALEYVVAQRLRATERSISPHEAFCPACRDKLDVHEYGIM